MNNIIFLLFWWITLPHTIIFLISKRKEVIRKDVIRWAQCAHIHPLKQNFSKSQGGAELLINLIWLLLFVKEYRNVFYLRVGRARYILGYLRPLGSLYICTSSENFGAGTYIQHGFSTYITAEKIGENCWINQQVTIGYNDSKKYGYGKPVIGNNVRISAGAKVCGKVTIGDDSTIGINAVVIKNVPPGSTVVPSPMMLIRENGESVYKKL